MKCFDSIFGGKRLMRKTLKKEASVEAFLFQSNKCLSPEKFKDSKMKILSPDYSFKDIFNKSIDY